MIIGLTGTLGAGKDSAAKFFMKNGFSYHSCSDIIKKECEKKGILLDRDNLIKMGNELREKNGPNILARMIIERINAMAETDSLVVGIRNPEEVKALKKEKDFVMIAIDAPIDKRYEWIQKREREDDRISFEKFKQIENGQRSGDKNMQQLDKVMKMADHKIINDETLEQLQYKLEDLLDYLKQKYNKEEKKEEKEEKKKENKDEKEEELN